MTVPCRHDYLLPRLRNTLGIGDTVVLFCRKSLLHRLKEWKLCICSHQLLQHLQWRETTLRTRPRLVQLVLLTGPTPQTYASNIVQTAVYLTPAGFVETKLVEKIIIEAIFADGCTLVAQEKITCRLLSTALQKHQRSLGKRRS